MVEKNLSCPWRSEEGEPLQFFFDFFPEDFHYDRLSHDQGAVIRACGYRDVFGKRCWSTMVCLAIRLDNRHRVVRIEFWQPLIVRNRDTVTMEMAKPILNNR